MNIQASDQTAAEFYGAAYERGNAFTREKLDKAFRYLGMALRAEANVGEEDPKFKMAFKAAVQAEAEAFAGS